MPSENYGLIFPFNVDDGELDGLTPQEIFVLGFEIGDIRQRIEHGETIAGQLVHASNRRRIERLLEVADAWSLKYMPDDPAEEWMLLNVW